MYFGAIGIEPIFSDSKSDVLPFNYAPHKSKKEMDLAGLEPTSRPL
jgi:hypothetical protein